MGEGGSHSRLLSQRSFWRRRRECRKCPGWGWGQDLGRTLAGAGAVSMPPPPRTSNKQHRISSSNNISNRGRNTNTNNSTRSMNNINNNRRTATETARHRWLRPRSRQPSEAWTAAIRTARWGPAPLCMTGASGIHPRGPSLFSLASFALHSQAFLPLHQASSSHAPLGVFSV